MLPHSSNHGPSPLRDLIQSRSDPIILNRAIVLDPPRSAIVLTGRSSSPSALPFPTQHGLRWLHSPTKPERRRSGGQSMPAPGPLADSPTSRGRPVRGPAGPGSPRWMHRRGADAATAPPGRGPSLAKPDRHQDEGDGSHGISAIYTSNHSPGSTHHLHSIYNIRLAHKVFEGMPMSLAVAQLSKDPDNICEIALNEYTEY